MTKILLEDLTKIYEGGTVALEDFNLEIESGAFISLLGPSGCGKTTTLKLIAGLLDPTKGRILFDGEDVTYTLPQQRGVGLVFQDYAVFPHMTGYENISYGLKVRKLSKKEIRDRVIEVANLLEIGDILDKKPREMNISELQRVSLARTLVIKPKVLLLDEPLSNLDASLRVRTRIELKKLQRILKQTIIYVTHDQVEALTLSDKVAVMSMGKLQQYDTPKNIFLKPKNKFVAGFIGSPPMNLIPCSVIQKDESLMMDANTFKIDVTELKDVLNDYVNKEVTIGIRPQDITPSLKGGIFKAKVYSVEHIGMENIITAKADDIMIKSIAQKDFIPNLDEELWFKFEINKLYIFDKEGERIWRS
ncbi:MAG: ABC transporter ATP-binding protein [Nitrososphaerales archaeon]